MPCTVITPEKHVVKDTPVARFFRRALGVEDIITFYHMETGQWILAYWVNKLGNIVDEIDDLGTHFELVTPEFVDMVRSGWGGINWAEKKKWFLAKHKEKITKDNEASIQDQDRWDWAKKRSGKIPYLVQPPTG